MVIESKLKINIESKQLTNGKQDTNDPSANPNLKERFNKICRDKKGFELDDELVQISKEWQIPLQDCRFLWENYCQSDRKLSPFQQCWQATWKKVTQLSGTLVTVGHFSILIGVILFIISAENREDKATEDTWKLINSVGKEVVTNSGRIDALQLLNRGCNPNYKPWGVINDIPLIRGFFPDCIDLVGLNVSNANLNKIDLQHGQLSQAAFEKAQLQAANFSGANLQSSKFNEATLNRAIFNDAKLMGANLAGASLINARLKEADLSKADLSYADLRGADLRGANLLDTETEEANFKGAIFDSSTQSITPDFHKDLLKRGAYFIDCKKVKDANLKEVDLKGIDLSDTNFANANLERANLAETILSGANLEDANLTQANLRGANLNGVSYNSETTFTNAIYDEFTVRSPSINWLLIHGINKTKAYKIEANANLKNALLANANLRNADLSHAILTGADLRKADLRGADLTHTVLGGAILTNALYDIKTKLPEKFKKVFENEKVYKIDTDSHLNGADLSGQNLEDVNLAYAKLKKADLKKTNLNGAKLKGANLTDADLNEATLIKANLKNADLREADLTDANLKDADLEGTFYDSKTKLPEKFKADFSKNAHRIEAKSNLNKADLYRRDLSGANLEDAKLNNAKLEGASLIKANLKEADLTHANLKGADLTGADLTKADLHKADLTEAKGLTLEQVQLAKNWRTAKYTPEFAKRLGLPTSSR